MADNGRVERSRHLSILSDNGEQDILSSCPTFWLVAAEAGIWAPASKASC